MQYAALIFMCAAFFIPVIAHAQHDGPFDFPAIVGDREPAIGPKKTFHHITCEKDCKKEKAGYEWAKAENVDNADLCPTKNVAFGNGCRAYIREMVAAGNQNK